MKVKLAPVTATISHMIPVVARSLVFAVKKGVMKAGIEKGARASRLDTETGLAPMSSLGVVPVAVSLRPCCMLLPVLRVERSS